MAVRGVSSATPSNPTPGHGDQNVARRAPRYRTHTRQSAPRGRRITSAPERARRRRFALRRAPRRGRLGGALTTDRAPAAGEQRRGEGRTEHPVRSSVCDARYVASRVGPFPDGLEGRRDRDSGVRYRAPRPARSAALGLASRIRISRRRRRLVSRWPMASRLDLARGRFWRVWCRCSVSWTDTTSARPRATTGASVALVGEGRVGSITSWIAASIDRAV